MQILYHLVVKNTYEGKDGQEMQNETWNGNWTFIIEFDAHFDIFKHASSGIIIIIIIKDEMYHKITKTTQEFEIKMFTLRIKVKQYTFEIYNTHKKYLSLPLKVKISTSRPEQEKHRNSSLDL